MNEIAAKNPYTRLRELTGQSQREYAKAHKLSRVTLVQIETGQFADLSDRMVIELGKACFEKSISASSIIRSEYNAENLQTAYHNWQTQERAKNAHLFQVPPPEQWTKDLSPFHFFIKETVGSAQGFSKKLKVPSATVTRYASGSTLSMPKAIENALREVRFPYMEKLLSLQSKWVETYR